MVAVSPLLSLLRLPSDFSATWLLLPVAAALCCRLIARWSIAWNREIIMVTLLQMEFLYTSFATTTVFSHSTGTRALVAAHGSWETSSSSTDRRAAEVRADELHQRQGRSSRTGAWAGEKEQHGLA